MALMTGKRQGASLDHGTNDFNYGRTLGGDCGNFRRRLRDVKDSYGFYIIENCIIVEQSGSPLLIGQQQT